MHNNSFKNSHNYRKTSARKGWGLMILSIELFHNYMLSTVNPASFAPNY